MSKDITIQQTGVAKKLNTISEIQTAQQGGGSITWVPEEERKVMKKTITKEGTYKAKDDNVYAYSEVVVNMSGSSDAEKPKKEPYKAITPDITIQEGGVGKAMYNVKKLKISLQDGDDACYWIPEDNVQTKTLTVHGNGTFKANDQGVYGFTEVKVTKKVKRVYHNDEDGNDYVEYEDGTIEKIPSSIKITTPPDKTDYNPYEVINTAGMVVTGYYGDGSEYGVIPRDELTIDPIVAPESGDIAAPDKGEYYDAYGHSFSVARLHIGSVVIGNMERPIGTRTWTLTQADGNVYAIRWSSGNYEYVAVISTKTFTLHYAGPTGMGDGWTEEDHVISPVSGYGYYPIQCLVGRNNWVPVNDPTDGTARNKIYRDIAAFDESGELESDTKVTVIWVRPEDEKSLTDTFEITIGEVPVPAV